MGSIHGDRSDVQEKLRQFEDCGVGRYVVTTGALTPEYYKPRLERYASLYLKDR
jgi:hypothetical protein